MDSIIIMGKPTNSGSYFDIFSLDSQVGYVGLWAHHIRLCKNLSGSSTFLLQEAQVNLGNSIEEPFSLL